jgi:hypothetical protein
MSLRVPKCYHAFLSYNSQDRWAVRVVAERLEGTRLICSEGLVDFNNILNPRTLAVRPEELRAIRRAFLRGQSWTRDPGVNSGEAAAEDRGGA